MAQGSVNTKGRKAPPLPPVTRRKVPGEDALFARWEPVVWRMSARVFYPGRLGMDREGVAQELALAMTVFVRRYYCGYGCLPEDAYIRHSLKWRRSGLIRATRVPFRVQMELSAQDNVFREGYGDHEGTVNHREFPDEKNPLPDQVLEQSELDTACAALAYAIRNGLSPAAFATLHLRYVEGVTPMQVSEATAGVVSPEQVSKGIQRAKTQAAAFLAGLGIDEWDDLMGCGGDVNE